MSEKLLFRKLFLEKLVWVFLRRKGMNEKMKYFYQRRWLKNNNELAILKVDCGL